MKAVEVTICLGSSCFARGNRKTLTEIQEYLKEHKIEEKVVFRGNHCFGMCNKGPVIKINGTIYEEMDAEEACRIIDGELNKNIH